MSVYNNKHYKVDYLCINVMVLPVANNIRNFCLVNMRLTAFTNYLKKRYGDNNLP